MAGYSYKIDIKDYFELDLPLNLFMLQSTKVIQNADLLVHFVKRILSRQEDFPNKNKSIAYNPKSNNKNVNNDFITFH